MFHSAVIHVLLLSVGLLGLHLAREGYNANQTEGERAVVKAYLDSTYARLAKLQPAKRAKLLRLSDEEIRRFWLYPPLQRLNAAFKAAVAQQERTEAWRCSLLLLVVAICSALLAFLGKGKGVVDLVLWPVLSLLCFLFFAHPFANLFLQARGVAEIKDSCATPHERVLA